MKSLVHTRQQAGNTGAMQPEKPGRIRGGLGASRTVRMISCCWCRFNLVGRPTLTPRSRAATRPARVRSRTIERSNSAKLPSICITIRPAEVVVSTASVRLRKAPKAGAGVAHPLHDMQQIFQRARKPVELPNHQHVPFPELLQGLVKFRPVPPTTGSLLFEDARAAGLA